MTTYIINGRAVIPKRIFLDQTQWFLEVSENNKKSNLSLHDIGDFDGKFIDEVVIIRPLTNRIDVDPQTNDVLKIHVDQKDTVFFMSHENRQMSEIRSVFSLDLDNLNDALVKKRKRR